MVQWTQECIFWDPDDNSFGYIPRKEIAGSHSTAIFVFFFLRTFHTVFQNGCTNLYLANCIPEFPMLHFLTNIFYLFDLLVIAILRWPEVISQLFWFVFLWWLVMVGTCSPKSTCLLWGNVYSVAHFFPHVFDKGFICWSLRSKIQKNISLSHCKNTAIIKHFPSSSPLFPWWALPYARYHRADWHPEIVGKALGMVMLLMPSATPPWQASGTFSVASCFQ